VRQSLRLGKELIGEDGDVRRLQSRRAEDVYDLLRVHDAGDNLPDRDVEILALLLGIDADLAQAGAHGLVETEAGAQRRCFVRRGGHGEPPLRHGDGSDNSNRT